ncbi:MAG TPA: alpha/beta hydrolase [Woeseiaceae bacterium]|nr:alpha/beta hydrolase [Woeseiaceae bacterium]
MPRLLATLLLTLVSAVSPASECVILLHGLARTSMSMDVMQEALEEDGYLTANVDYPSREYAIAELAQIAVDEGLEKCRAMPEVTTIHFVTHSLGGILVRQYISERPVAELGRVVMLAPPNQGSAAADEFDKLPGFDWINGPAGRQLGKGEDSVPLALGPVTFELGVIAGDRTVDPITSALLDDPDDGKVSVEDTRVEGMDDFVVVHHSHAFMMRMKTVTDLTLAFLKNGSFGEQPD